MARRGLDAFSLTPARRERFHGPPPAVICAPEPAKGAPASGRLCGSDFQGVAALDSDWRPRIVVAAKPTRRRRSGSWVGRQRRTFNLQLSTFNLNSAIETHAKAAKSAKERKQGAFLLL